MTTAQFRALKAKLGWPFSKIAYECGVNQNTAIKWSIGEMKGGIPPPAARLLRILAKEELEKEAIGGDSLPRTRRKVKKS